MDEFSCTTKADDFFDLHCSQGPVAAKEHRAATASRTRAESPNMFLGKLQRGLAVQSYGTPPLYNIGCCVQGVDKDIHPVIQLKGRRY